MRASFAIAALATAVSSVSAVDHLVTVGANGVLAFNPPQVMAAQGDTVTFEFHPKNHSVGQSTFAAPCTEMAGGVTSGFLATPATATQFSQWQITIDNASAPLWFYCQQTNPVPHCGMGMVFAVNPTAEKSFNMYQATANATLNNAGGAPAAGASQAGATATGGAPAGSTDTAAAGGANAVGATDTAAQASPTDTTGGNTVGGNTAAGNTVGPIGQTTSGSVPTNAVPAAASGATNATAAGAASTQSAGSGALPRVGSAMTLSGTVVLGAVVALLL